MLHRPLILTLFVTALTACSGGGSSVSSGDLGTGGGSAGGGGGGGGGQSGPLRGSLGSGTGTARNQGGAADAFSVAAFFAGASAAPPLQNATTLMGAIDTAGLPTATPAAIENRPFVVPASWPPASATDAVSVALAGNAGTPFMADSSYSGAYDPSVAAADQWTAGWTIAIGDRTAAWGFFGRDASSGIDRAPGTALAGQFGPIAQGSSSGCPVGTTYAGRFSETFGALGADEAGLFAGITGDYDICKLPARLLSPPLNIDLTNDNVYEIADGAPGTYVGRGEAARPGAQSLVRLRIQAGTLIFGEAGEALVVTRGANIQASGLVTAPIVMTSRQQLAARFDGDPTTSPDGDPGGWGGLVLMGTARDNQCLPDFANCDVAAPAGLGFYGGNDDASTRTSGFLDYVVVRQAGGDMDATGMRLGGLSLFGVVRNTRMNFVQVHASGGDGVLVRGGNAFIGHVLLTASADDSLDYSNGWTGGLQHVLAIQAGNAAENGIHGASGPAAGPVSFPLLANVTLLAPASRTPANRAASNAQGVLLRDGTRAQAWNSIVAGDFFNGCLDIDDGDTFARAAEAGGMPADAPGPHLVFRNSITDCSQVNFNENG